MSAVQLGKRLTVETVSQHPISIQPSPRIRNPLTKSPLDSTERVPLLLLDLAIIELSRRRGWEVPRTGTLVQVCRRVGREDGLVVPEDVQPEREPRARPVERRARRANAGAARREQRALCHLGLGRGLGRGSGVGGSVGGCGEPVEEDRA